jgi:hypothetical protein
MRKVTKEMQIAIEWMGQATECTQKATDGCMKLRNG